MVRPLIASSVSSRKPDSFSVSVCSCTWKSISSATFRQVSIAAGIEPQSSWILSPRQPAAICSTSERGLRRVAASEEAEIHRPLLRPPAASCRRSTAPPQSMPTVIGPSEPPIIVVMPDGDRMLDQLRAVEMHVHVDAAGRRDQAFAIAHRGRRAAQISLRMRRRP